MPQVRCIGAGFPGHYNRLNGPTTIDISWLRLIHAAITVGRRDWWEVMRPWPWWLPMAFWRLHQPFAILRRQDGDFVRSPGFDAFDPTEKAHLSNQLGMVLAKVIAENQFDVPWLMHVRAYGPKENVVFNGSNRPDLFGLQRNVRDWVVVEAKGRSGGFESRAMDQAKRQVAAITSIGGRPPLLRVGVVSYFRNGVLECRTQDPEGDQRKPVDLPLDPGEFLKDYYRPFQTLVRGGDTEVVGGIEYLVATEFDPALRVGLWSALAREAGAIAHLAGELRERQSDARADTHGDSSIFVGSDGILVGIRRPCLTSDRG